MTNPSQNLIQVLRQMPRRLFGRGAAVGPVVALLGAGLAVAIPAAGCGSSAEDDANNTCVSTRDEFTQSMYPILQQNCLGCHGPGGTADAAGAKFKLVRETYPDFVSANVSSMREYAKLESEGKALLLRKPLGDSNHGGGAILKEDSPEYKKLVTFVNELKTGQDRFCAEGDPLGAQSLSFRQTYRKAAIILGGKVPTDAELATINSEADLDNAVIELTKTEPFYDRLRDFWNDGLLTDRGINVNRIAQMYGAECMYWEQDTDKCPAYQGAGELRQYASRALTEEPLRYIEYVVRNNLPFSDIVAGNYIVANPFSAAAYNLKHDLPPSPENYNAWKKMEFAPVQTYEVGYGENAKKVSYKTPVAGVLSSPSFLTRWETTPTNKSRKRARIVLKNFLATDIFKFAQRPVDSTQLTSIQNPTSNSQECKVCHAVVDPIAGGFRGFDEDDMIRYDGEDKWHDDMVPPGYQTAQMPQPAYAVAVSWLGNQIPTDQRFGIAVAQTMYRGIVGDEVLAFPDDKAAPDYNDRVKAFNLQNDWLLSVGQKFAVAKFDLRVVVAEIVKSPYFRAASGDPKKDGLHGGLGQGRLLTPEILALKYQAATGLRYFNFEAVRNNPLRKADGYRTNDVVDDEDWRILLGGIDSGDVTKRSDTTTPVMLATNQFMAASVACRVTSFEFTKPAAERRMLGAVELNTVPFAPRATANLPLVANPEAEPKIRAAIKNLHWRFFGEDLDVNSAEVTRTFNLFIDVWKDLENGVASKVKGASKGLPGRCHANVNYDAEPVFGKNDQNQTTVSYPRLKARPDGAEYVTGMVLQNDENFTVRAWQAVLTYMMSDYRFTHE
jgi:Protein of unknown function (DUF1588)